MARKSSRKKKKSQSKWLSIILVLVIVALCSTLFLKSEKGQQTADKASDTVQTIVDKGKETIEDVKDSELVQNIVNPDSKNEADADSKDTPTADNDDIRVDFIDVGQGDSELITTANGKYILIDAGPAGSKNALVRYLKNAGVSEIEYFVLTHPHADHIGGAAKVLSDFKINNVIMPDVATTSATFTKLIEAIAAEKETGCKVYSAVPGDKYSVDNCNMTVLAPHAPDEDDLNNCSVVVKFEYRDFSAMFTGDAEAKSEKLILDSGIDVNCDILKAGHHGSSTSTSIAFLDAVSPDACIISCEEGNSYGHPHAEILAALGKRNIPYYITSENGSISIVSDGKDFVVNTEKE